MQNQSFREASDELFHPHVVFIAVPGEPGRFLISEIVDNSRFPSDRISVSVPCRSNLAPAEKCFH